MRFWYLSISVVPSTTANSVHAMKMAAAFATVGDEVRLYAWQKDGRDPFHHYGVARCFELVRVPVWRVPGGGTLPFLARLHRDLLLSERPDLIYGRNFLGVAAAARLGLPTMLEVHNPPASARHERVLDRLTRRESFKGLVTISRALEQEYLRRYPRLDGRTFVAPDGADPFPEITGPADAAPAGGGERLQVGYVGSLYPGKGVEMVVQLAAACPHMDFHVVGGSSEQVDHWRKALHRAGGTEKNTTFHGYVPHGDLHRHFVRCDVFVAPYQPTVRGAGHAKDLSRWMSPLKIFEYMAAGKPMVCSDLPVLREVLEDGRDALLAPPTLPAAWIDALTRLERSPELRARLSTCALEQFEARYTWESRARRISAFAAEALEGARRSRVEA